MHADKVYILVLILLSSHLLLFKMFLASSVPALTCNLCSFCFQLTLTIVRQTGGLGISIAGGKGSTPYKGDDEVRPWTA